MFLVKSLKKDKVFLKSRVQKKSGKKSTLFYNQSIKNTLGNSLTNISQKISLSPRRSSESGHRRLCVDVVAVRFSPGLPLK